MFHPNPLLPTGGPLEEVLRASPASKNAVAGKSRTCIAELCFECGIQLPQAGRTA
jgi:hypothetical protein